MHFFSQLSTCRSVVTGSSKSHAVELVVTLHRLSLCYETVRARGGRPWRIFLVSVQFWCEGAALLAKLWFYGWDCASFAMCAAWDGKEQRHSKKRAKYRLKPSIPAVYMTIIVSCLIFTFIARYQFLVRRCRGCSIHHEGQKQSTGW